VLAHCQTRPAFRVSLNWPLILVALPLGSLIAAFLWINEFPDAIAEYRKVGPHIAFLDDVDLGPGQRQELEELSAQSKDSISKAEQAQRRAAAQAQQGGRAGQASR